MEGSRLGDDALVFAGLGELIQALAAQKADRRVVVFGQTQHSLHCALCRAFEKVELLDRPPCAVSFNDGVAAFDPVFIGFIVISVVVGSAFS